MERRQDGLSGLLHPMRPEGSFLQEFHPENKREMNTEDYVSYPLALALKKTGFDEPCYAQWACEPDGKPIIFGSTAFVFRNSECKGRDVAAPFIWQAQKWLRDKGVAVSVQASEIQGELWYSADIISTEGLSELVDGGFDYMAYESALSAEIAVALELIEKNKKQLNYSFITRSSQFEFE